MADTAERIRDLPCWDGPVSWERLKGGLSNESFVVTHGGERFVVRFGTDFPFHHVSRERELMAARAAHATGFGPEVVHAEPGVMVIRFLEARTFGRADVRENIGRVAETVARFHRAMLEHVRGPAHMFWVFHMIRDYARRLEEDGSRMAKELPGYLALARELEDAQVSLPIIYGHNDLLPQNMMDDGGRIWLIDYEYAGFSTPMFDLAGIASNAEFDHGQSAQLLEAYFGTPPGEDLLRSHAATQCASLLREAMWSMVSEIHLGATGVDYVAYTKENLDLLGTALSGYRSRYGKG